MISFLNKIFLFELLIIFFELNIFSCIYLNNLKLKYRIIVSLGISKGKINAVLMYNLIKSLLNQTLIPYKILISINKADIFHLSDFIKILVKINKVELIVINKDLKELNKYYYIPNKYKKYIIIVFDANAILEENSIERLFESYKLNPNAISANRVYKMNFNQKWILMPFTFWDFEYKNEKNPRFSLFAIHGAGALFPPNTLNFLDDFILYFEMILNAQDFIIKYFELQKNLKTVYVYNEIIYSPLNIKFYEKYNSLITVTPDEDQLKEDFGINYNYSPYKNIKKEKVEILKKVKEYFLNTENNNKITDETLLVSMTSYPARIDGISEVFLSLLNQSANISSYQCFLTLAKEEFKNGEKDLPPEIQKLITNGWIKIIWHHNIYSYKRLIPILLKYPENDILIIDDDIIRENNFIDIFQSEHRLYPTDIICGAFMFFFDNNIEMKKLIGYKDENYGEINPVPNIIFQTAVPRSGVGGVLYPKHTFSDERFFNETLYMNLSPYSDELWQYIFNIIENKVLRQTSIIFDNSINVAKGSPKIKTCQNKFNITEYSLLNNYLINIFPEYKFNSLERQKKIIVSLTSYKQRLKKLNLVLESIFKNTMKPSKIVLTLYKNDLKFLTKYLTNLIDDKKIELIVTDKDIKSHKKYFEVMKKYRDYSIITIDDDIIYTKDLIETLYNSYLKYPNCIHARRVHKIMIENNKVLPYNKWLKQYTLELNPSFYLFPTSGGGTLFPPNILNISDDNIDEIYKCLSADDIYLKYLSRKRNIKIVWVPNQFVTGQEQLTDIRTQRKALYNINVLGKRLNNVCLKIFSVI